MNCDTTSSAPSDVGEREVHLVVRVGEQSEPDDLVGHPAERGLAVGVREADEQQEAAVDATGDAFADAHFGAGDSLQDDAHGAGVRKTPR